MVARRMLGPGWTSRLLQAVLLDPLTHADPQESVREKLKDRGIAASPGDGINVWIPVENERSALITLAAAGVRVAPGSPFVVTADSTTPHANRVTTGRLPDDEDPIEEVACVVARAAGSAGGAPR